MNEKEMLLINDVLSSCPEAPEHQFTPYYLRQRKRNINKNFRNVRKVRKRMTICVIAAVMLLAVMGFQRITFMNGFKITKDRTFLHITQQIAQTAPEKIEKSPYPSGNEAYSCTISTEKPQFKCSVFRTDDKKYTLYQYTIDYFNEDMEHLVTSDIEYELFYTDDKSGIYFYLGENCHAMFQYGGYVFKANCKGDISDLTNFISKLKF